MNDLERRLKDALDADAAKAPLVSAPPDGLRRRVRGRQVARSAVVMLTVSAVALVSFAGLRAIDRGTDDGRIAVDDPWAGYEVFDRTAKVGNFTITSPSDWYLVNQWPWARTVATDLGEQREQDVEACGEEPTRDERQACHSFHRRARRRVGHADPAAQRHRPGPRELPVLRPVLLDRIRGRRDDDRARQRLHGRELRRGRRRPQWPVAVRRAAGRGTSSCGPGTYVYFASGDIPYVAHFAFGDAVPEDERQTLINAFEGMQVDDSQEVFMDEPKPDDVAAYVVAGGENAAGPWTLELRPQSEPGYLSNVQLQLTTAEGAGMAAGGPFTVNEDHPIEQAGGDPVFGAVVKEADGVELHLEEGTPTIPAKLVPLPPSMPFDFDLFFAPNDTDVAATAVPLGIAPNRDPSTTTDGRQIVAEGMTGDTPWALEFSRIPGKNALVLRDMRDGSILARLEPDSLNRVHTSGLEFVPRAMPGGSFLIFGVAAPAATRLAIALDHGSVTYLETGDPRWDPLPILRGTASRAFGLWWAELPIDVGEVVTFSATSATRSSGMASSSRRAPSAAVEMTTVDASRSIGG